MENLDKYKYIYLPAFMEEIGLEKHKDHRPSNLKYTDKNGEIYLPYKHAGKWYYSNVFAGQAKGGKSIFDLLMQQNLASNFNEAIAYISGKNIQENTFSSPAPAVKTNQNKNFHDLLNKLNPPTPKSLQFFWNRQINSETINHPYFKPCIKSYAFDNSPFENTAYPMYNENGKIAAIGLRNDNFSGCLGDRGQSIAISHKTNDKPADYLFFTETLDDAMSHYQLNHNDLQNKNIRYIAPQGSFLHSQIPVIEKAISHIKPKSIVAAFDNDVAGHFYAAKLKSALASNNNFQIDAQIIPNKTGNKPATGRITFNYNLDNSDIINKKTDQQFSVIQSKNKTIIEFQHNSHNWQKTLDLIPSPKINFLRHKPLTIDFNDDLKTLKDKHPNFFIIEKNGKPTGQTHADIIRNFSLSDQCRLTGINNENIVDRIDFVNLNGKLTANAQFKGQAQSMKFNLSLSKTSDFIKEHPDVQNIRENTFDFSSFSHNMNKSFAYLNKNNTFAKDQNIEKDQNLNSGKGKNITL